MQIPHRLTLSPDHPMPQVSREGFVTDRELLQLVPDPEPDIGFGIRP